MSQTECFIRVYSTLAMCWVHSQKSVHIDQVIYDTIDNDRHFKWHYEYADLVRRRLSNPLAPIYVWTFLLRNLVECIINGGLPLVSSDTNTNTPNYLRWYHSLTIMYHQWWSSTSIKSMVVFHWYSIQILQASWDDLDPNNLDRLCCW